MCGSRRYHVWERKVPCVGVGGMVRGNGSKRHCVWEQEALMGAGGTLHGSRRHSAWEQDREMGRL